jgi:hypothetical protein
LSSGTEDPKPAPLYSDALEGDKESQSHERENMGGGVPHEWQHAALALPTPHLVFFPWRISFPQRILAVVQPWHAFLDLYLDSF